MKHWVVLLIAISLTACGASKPKVKPDPLQETERVLFMSRAHKPWLRVVKSKIEKLPGGQMQVVLALENIKNKDIMTDVQVIFRGADGFEVETTSWTPFMLDRRKVSTFRTSSMSPDVADYRIVIRKPQ